MFELIIGAFFAGLVGSPHCMGMCGGFASACARSVRGSVAWHAGRLSMYALLGAFVGFAGHIMPGPPWIPMVLSAVLLIWFAGSLAGVLPQVSFRIPGLTLLSARIFASNDVLSRYCFGLATALLPCGFLYFGLSFAIASASPFVGALCAVSFGLGTVPALAFLSRAVHSLAARGIWARRAIAVAVLFAGITSIALRLVHTHSMH